MAIDLKAWEGYRVVWFRVEAASEQANSTLTWSQAMETYCRLSHSLLAQVHLQAEDNQSDRFIQAVAAAINQVAGLAICSDLSSPAADESSAWIDLINRVGDTGQSLLLALDGYDQIESSLIHEMMADLIEYPPAGLQIALFSQGTPPLPFARLRARRVLLEVEG